jgi:hypothetical protein
LDIEALSDRTGCRLISAAFNDSLSVLGLTPEEFTSLLRADSRRPSWPGVAARGRIRMGGEHDLLDELRAEHRPHDLPGGRAYLASDQAGEVRLDPAAEVDQHLLPPPLNLLMAQQWARLARFPLHAAALRWKGRGVLILGERGAGKSSLVLAALTRGAEVVSDDWLLAGAPNGTVRVERLREFLMFRSGTPWQAFGKRLQQITGQAVLSGPDGRFVLKIPDSRPFFPVWIPIEQTLFLRVPEGERRSQSRLDPIHQSRLLAGLVEASMPLLLTDEFGIERKRLMTAFRKMTGGVPARAAELGQDLVYAPEATLDRLLAPAAVA